MSISAAVAVAVMIVAHEVMLPFVLAAVIAYVLTPLVAMVERRKVPRAILAVLVVYAVVLGSMATFTAVVAPRIGLEFRNLRGELPALAKKRRATSGSPRSPSACVRWATAPTATSAGRRRRRTHQRAFVARPQADGSLAIDVGTGVLVTETKTGWLVEPAHDKKGEPFDPNRFVAEWVGRTFAYAQENSLEIARAVRGLVMEVSRLIFVFFITLMLAAYMMAVTRRAHRRLLPVARAGPAGRPGFDALLGAGRPRPVGVVRGQLVICGINGALSAIGFAFIGLEVLARDGARRGRVLAHPDLRVDRERRCPRWRSGWTQGLGTATFVLVWIVGIHQLEANLLNPKIMGDAAKIHPVLVIFSLLVGEHFLHAVGALLAVPVTASIAQSVFLHLSDATAEDVAETQATAPHA